MASETCNIIEPSNQEVKSNLEIYPSVKGREHLYGWYPPGYNTLSIPSYKIPSTFDEELRFNSLVKENISRSLVTEETLESGAVSDTVTRDEAPPKSSTPQQICEDNQASSKNEPLVIVQPPTIRSSSRQSTENNSKPRLGLHARLEAIRLDLMNRQRQGPPLMRAVSAQGKPQFAFNRKAKVPKSASTSVARPVFNPIPTEWINRIPEPDLRFTRSPKQSRPSSQQSATSLSRSMTLPTPPQPTSDAVDNQQIDIQERPPSPALISQHWVNPPSSNRPSLPTRPKTAPTSLMHRKQNLESYKSSPASRLQSTGTPKQSLSRSYCIEAKGGLDLWLQGHQLSVSKPLTSKEKTIPMRPKTAYPRVELPNAPTELVSQNLSDKEPIDEENKSEHNGLTEELDAGLPNDEPFDEHLVIKDLLEDEYTKQLNKHGWRMEIPYDPLGLKAPLIPGRSSCSVKLVEPEILPQPPAMHKENKETFFHNVMSTKRTRFEISPDFMSEHYNRAKDEMRKRGLWKYSEKNFSFLY